MLDQSFSPKNLLQLMKPWESRRFRIRGGLPAIQAAASDIVGRINDGTFTFEGVNCRRTKKSFLYSSNSMGTVLVQRKLNENFRRIYKVRQSNRRNIVSQIHSLLCEPVPKHIIKLDISSFYESISRESVIRKIVRQGPMSLDTKIMIDSLFSSPIFADTSGLPRGVGLSASISEYYMRDFDKMVTRMTGVYFYCRYVDDILVFCYKNPDLIRSNIISLLKREGLDINEAKSPPPMSVLDCLCETTCKCGGRCQCHQKCSCAAALSDHISVENFNPMLQVGSRFDHHILDYLGYRFAFPPLNMRKAKNLVTITISPKKLEKIKSRIVLTIKRYLIEKDFPLLRDRLRFLMSNYRVGWRGNSAINAGIFYNYSNLTISRNDGGSNSAILSLDDFVKYMLNRSDYRFQLSSLLTRRQRRQIFGMSFKHGYQYRRLYKFSRKKMQRIKEAWRYEYNNL